jgi:predicted GNAT family acetyltransferase
VPWEFTEDVEVFAELAWELLAAHPVENTITLTVIENLRADQQPASGPTLFGWYDHATIRAAVSLTPPHNLVLTVVPDATLDELVDSLRERRLVLPGVRGEAAIAERFAQAWADGILVQAIPDVRQRLYALGVLGVPPAVAGRARRAHRADAELVVEFFTDFHTECHDAQADSERTARERVDGGFVWLWEVDGAVTSMAACNRTVAGIARVGPVYTPPEHRKRGYGTAVTAECTRDALVRGAGNVVLFTDLANPTSNAIYQQIGYRPVRDDVAIRFIG